MPKGALDRRSVGRWGDRVGSGLERLRIDSRASGAIYLFYLLIWAGKCLGAHLGTCTNGQ